MQRAAAGAAGAAGAAVAAGASRVALHALVALRGWKLATTICIYDVRYEWDERKNSRNQAKHDGISFALAALVFEDPYCLVGADRIDDNGEQRWHALGAVRIEPGGSAVLMVVHAYREDHDGEEIIRIISARSAEKHEVRRYRQQAMDGERT